MTARLVPLWAGQRLAHALQRDGGFYSWRSLLSGRCPSASAKRVRTAGTAIRGARAGIQPDRTDQGAVGRAATSPGHAVGPTPWSVACWMLTRSDADEIRYRFQIPSVTTQQKKNRFPSLPMPGPAIAPYCGSPSWAAAWQVRRLRLRCLSAATRTT